jgi:hypothetical protein
MFDRNKYPKLPVTKIRTRARRVDKDMFKFIPIRIL